jgi:signal transduction histidine kinase
MMQKILSQLWNRIINIGVAGAKNTKEVWYVQMTNKLAVPVFTLQFLIHLQNIIKQEYIQIYVGNFILIATSAIVFFNKIHKNFFARLTINLFYPIIIFGLAICYGKEFHVQFAYMVIILTSVILHKSPQIRIPLIIWSVTLYFMGEYFSDLYPPLFNLKFSPFDKYVIFLSSVLSIVMIIEQYIYENDTIKAELQQSMEMVSLRNEELNLANSELERFAYVASHDLKTPLRTMVSYLDIIDKKIKKQDFNEIDTYIAYVRNGGKQMNALINEILEYSKLNINQTLETENVELNDVVKDNIQSLDNFIKEKNAVVVAEDLPAINSNKLLIRLLFQNLIENGIKYNQSNPPIIRIYYQKNKDGIIITFEDNGIGIEKDFTEKIFDMFTKLHAHSDGSGMGLAICKKILERINGKIWLDSEIGRGSKFHIQLFRPILSEK